MRELTVTEIEQASGGETASQDFVRALRWVAFGTGVLAAIPSPVQPGMGILALTASGLAALIDQADRDLPPAYRPLWPSSHDHGGHGGHGGHGDHLSLGGNFDHGRHSHHATFGRGSSLGSYVQSGTSFIVLGGTYSETPPSQVTRFAHM